MITMILSAMGVMRVLLGLAPFVAAGAASRLMGFPKAHDTATTRLMARLFGVRDVGLGVLVYYGIGHPAALGFILLFNALTDLGDLIAISVPLVRRQGIDRAAWTSAAFAFVACLGWLTLFSIV